MEREFKHFDFVRFSLLNNWSVLSHLRTDFGYAQHYPLVRIGEFLHQEKNEIVIDDACEYKQITVRTAGGGVAMRGTKKGNEIGTKKQWKARKGQFILSKIDARNGSMGIIPEELDGAVVTHDFPLFNIDTKLINPQFLLLITTTKKFIEYAQSCSSGTTNRQRIDVNKFLDTEIPLPSIPEQNELVEHYDNQICRANTLTDEVHETRIKMQQLLMDKLKITITSSESTEKLHFVNYRNLRRWDVPFLMDNKKVVSIYPIITLGDCIEHFLVDEFGNSLREETYLNPLKKYHYIGMECVEKNTGKLSSIASIHGEDVKSQTMKVPCGFYIYGKLRPYLNKYWYNDHIKDDVVCSSEFFVFKLHDWVNNDYFKILLGSSIVQKQIADICSGARMPRIGESSFKNTIIPYPSQEIQKQIVMSIKNFEDEVEKKIEESADLYRNANLDFESTIFDNNKSE